MTHAAYVWNHHKVRGRRLTCVDNPCWLPAKPWEKACFGIGWNGESYAWLRNLKK